MNALNTATEVEEELSEEVELEDNPVIIHAIEIDGAVYPPIEEACKNCAYARSSNHYDQDDMVICGMREAYVDAMHWCTEFDLHPFVIPDEIEEYLDAHPEEIEEIEDGTNLLPEDREP